MTGRAPLIVVVAVLGATVGSARRASAAAGTAFAETSRVAALAGAVSARPGDAGSQLENPAGLADINEPVVLLNANAARLSQWFARNGEAQQDSSRWLGGFGFAAATPLPGPSWLRRFRVGMALDLPAAHVLRVAVSDRLDLPTSPIYDQRPDRVSALGTLAVSLLDRLNVGVGLAITPSLETPTTVGFVAGRDPSVERDVTVRLDRSMDLDAAPFLGVRAQPFDKLGLAVVYRASSISHATGNQRTVAGGVLDDDPVDYLAFWDPAQIVWGVAVGPFARWSLSLDATYNQWSRFRSGFDTSAVPPFKDTLRVSGGAEWKSNRWLTLRAGGGYEPSPVPDQYAESNYLGANTVYFAAGGGVDLRELLHAPLRVDGYLGARLGGTQNATKRASALSDADPNTPGQQIDNLGYPGFQSRSSLYQAGLTLTVFVGKEAR